MNTIPCEIIEDLLPSYKDNLLSESVNEAVTYHLEHCPKCAAKLYALENQLKQDDMESSQKEFAFLNRIKKAKHYVIGIIIGASIPIGALILFLIYVQVQSHFNF